jgi:hypothetical protein
MPQREAASSAWWPIRNGCGKGSKDEEREFAHSVASDGTKGFRNHVSLDELVSWDRIFREI